MLCFQDLRLTGVITFGRAGFMVVSRNATDVYEWDEDLEIISNTGLSGGVMSLKSFATVGVSANDLNC